MATKSKEVSLDMRTHIVNLNKSGKSYREIQKMVKLPFTTIGYIVRKYKNTGRVENERRPGSPSKLTSRNKRSIVKAAIRKPQISAQKIADGLLASSNIRVTAQTIRNVLHSAGLKGRTPRKKPMK
ncbi:hypothetical protein HNY73_011140 [Argiope bruennichi]|uniref:Transposase Tc1-like domain-containing protein n=1 Tax=Argiope bruennichi TaxID=94029 RepID=A0A8T0F9F4_ARGBR|nr:hypothetical protein HNY73_011140 [Argiope bruennichi]